MSRQLVTIDSHRQYVFDEREADAYCTSLGCIEVPPPGSVKPGRPREFPSYLLTHERKTLKELRGEKE